MIPTSHFLLIGAFLFCLGIYIMITKKNIIMILIGLELIFNAANINIVAFGRNDPSLQGQMFVLFVILIAVCEAAVALALMLNIYRYFKSVNPDDFSEIGEK